MSFNPNAKPSDDAGLFGLPYTRDESLLIVLPVPWDVTTSYGEGTHAGPEAVLKASTQVDLFDLEVGNAYECGYYMEDVPQHILNWNSEYRALAEQARRTDTSQTTSVSPDPNAKRVAALVGQVNTGSDKLNAWVYERAKSILAEGKFLALLGGDHSTPYSGIRAISEKYKGDFGILHIDAHADLREAYEGFQHSHASIMNNVMTSTFAPKKLVQVGIRDFCEDEYRFIQNSEGRIRTFFDLELKRDLAMGKTWMQLCDEMIKELPQNVYVSFDIDGFDPVLCPSTGTPVPGGLTFSDATFLLSSLHRHKKTIIGFDLNEVAPGADGDEWDGNVGSRIFYKMCGWLMITNGKAPGAQKI